MRAYSLPRSLFSGAGRQLGGDSRQLGKITLGDPVFATDGSGQVGDTGDVSSLPLDYAAGLQSGKYYVGMAQGASVSAAIPGDVGTPGAAGGTSFLTSITSALPALSSFITAEQLAQVNINRAKQGLPALQTSSYAPQVGVSIAPQTMTPIMIGAAVIAGLIIFRKKRRR
jgi:hypothetical protein